MLKNDCNIKKTRLIVNNIQKNAAGNGMTKFSNIKCEALDYVARNREVFSTKNTLRPPPSAFFPLYKVRRRRVLYDKVDVRLHEIPLSVYTFCFVSLRVCAI